MTDTASEDIEQQVAEMLNFLFTNSMSGDDYKLICEDEVIKSQKNCHILAPVALRTDATKNDFCLEEVNKDILKAATIIMKSLLALDKVTQDEDRPMVVYEVGMINGALVLLGNANYKSNLASQFAKKREINHKYTHICSEKVPVTCFLFGDDVS